MNEMPVSPAAPKNNTTIIIVVVVVVLLCCCCFVGIGGWVYGDAIIKAFGK
jgi:phosphate/sulfate permease